MIGSLIATIGDAGIDSAAVARALIYVGERFDVSLYVATPAEA